VIEPQEVLDVGTGTGNWAIDFGICLCIISNIVLKLLNIGDDNPQASVIGTDLSPIQPIFVPPNVRFQLSDMEEPWNFREKFDFIHVRMGFTWIKKVIQSAFESLNPGGYLELQDAVLPFRSDDSTLSGTALEYWNNLVISKAKELGKDWTCASQHVENMRKIGFIDVEKTDRKWPINGWPPEKELKEVGICCLQILLDGIEAFSMEVLVESGMMSEEEVQVLLTGVRKDLKDTRIHAYVPM
jgi:SAM-dependent methyltransferase